MDERKNGSVLVAESSGCRLSSVSSIFEEKEEEKPPMERPQNVFNDVKDPNILMDASEKWREHGKMIPTEEEAFDDYLGIDDRPGTSDQHQFDSTFLLDNVEEEDEDESPDAPLDLVYANPGVSSVIHRVLERPTIPPIMLKEKPVAPPLKLPPPKVKAEPKHKLQYEPPPLRKPYRYVPPTRAVEFVMGPAVTRAKRLFTCPVIDCPDSFPSLILLLEHLEYEHPTTASSSDVIERYHCDVCKVVFPTRDSVLDHIREYKGREPGECCACGRRFLLTSDVLAHLRRHTGEKPYSCKQCDYRCITGHTLRSHILNVHTKEGEGKRYPCGECEKAFKSRTSLNEHMKSHNEDTAYRCKFCDRICASAASLQSHERTHTGERPYTCRFCEKTFSQRTTLRSHLVTHTGERNYVCETCGKSFGQYATLATHRKNRHSEERPFVCEICNISFKVKPSLRGHWRSLHSELNMEDYPSLFEPKETANLDNNCSSDSKETS